MLDLDSTRRHALLAGLRLGLAHTFNFSSGHVRLGAFGELGGGAFQLHDPEAPLNPYATAWEGAGYGEAGATLGYAGAPAGGWLPFVQVEGAGGSTFGLAGELPSGVDREEVHWFRVGVQMGLYF